MTNFLRTCLRFTFLLLATRSFGQVDADASEKTISLYQNLKNIQNTNSFLFGQEFFNSFRYSSASAHGDESYSDSYAVTGSHPAVLGSDFHYYIEKNATERGYHTDAVKWAYQQGYVITFDWHVSARGTTSYAYVSGSQLANNIVNNLDGDRDWFYGELDKVIDIINNDLVVAGENIPIVFRPFHEMNGGWFWWGNLAVNATDYIALYRMLVDYVKERTNTVLFCWSPNSPVSFNHYPGNAYVDVLGLDAYEVTTTSARTQLGLIVDHAQENDKVAVFSETGYRLEDGTVIGDNTRSTYWKNTILPAILDDPTGKAKKIAWALTWINSSWSFPYVPHAASTHEAKQSFTEFRNSPNVIFGDEIPDVYTPTIVSIADNSDGSQARLQLSPIPVKDNLTVSLTGFDKATRISIYDVQGRLVYDFNLSGYQETFDTSFLKSGLYIVKASDIKHSLTARLLKQ